jgi:signal transduction histidine kinase
VRFDDRLATVLNGSFDSPRERSSRWQQLIDILAQDGAAMPSTAVERCLRLLSLLTPDVPPEIQLASARMVGARSNFAPLVTLLAANRPALATAIMPVVQLSEDDWLLTVPHVGPVGRSLLRQRTNLSPLVIRALQYFAPGDLTLGMSENVQPAAAEEVPEIKDLVRRIEEFRRRKLSEQIEPQDEPQTGLEETFCFTTDADGRITDIERAPRGRFVGIDLSQPARAVDVGCDAGTARIVGKRGIIDNGRLLLLGSDQWAGTWLCKATPQFDAEDGNFMGYVGVLRRPVAEEVVAESAQQSDTTSSAASGAHSDLLRQLTHELRSPLNAISGFAQMIEGQFAGPVSSSYRSAASVILTEAARLLCAIDEIDLLARIDRLTTDNIVGEANYAALLNEVTRDLNKAAGGSIFELNSDGSDDYGFVSQPILVAKLLRLWLQPLSMQARADETYQLTLDRADAYGAVLTTLPVPSIDASSGNDTSHLGLALAAASQIARDLGGELQVANDQHILNLPALGQLQLSEDRVG